MSDERLYRPLEGRQTTPRLYMTCKLCGRPLVRRTNSVNGSEFLGCSGYATGNCTHTEKLPEYIRLAESGAAQLPGMGDE